MPVSNAHQHQPLKMWYHPSSVNYRSAMLPSAFRAKRKKWTHAIFNSKPILLLCSTAWTKWDKIGQPTWENRHLLGKQKITDDWSRSWCHTPLGWYESRLGLKPALGHALQQSQALWLHSLCSLSCLPYPLLPLSLISVWCLAHWFLQMAFVSEISLVLGLLLEELICLMSLLLNVLVSFVSEE